VAKEASMAKNAVDHLGIDIINILVLDYILLG
jgi:hypothetical protein